LYILLCGATEVGENGGYVLGGTEDGVTGMVESVRKYPFIYEGTTVQHTVAVLPLPMVYTLLVYLLVIFHINTVSVIMYFLPQYCNIIITICLVHFGTFSAFTWVCIHDCHSAHQVYQHNYCSRLLYIHDICSSSYPKIKEHEVMLESLQDAIL